MPEFIGGSADLNRLQQHQGEERRADQGRRLRRQLHLLTCIREHEMAAAMNGLALHGGIIPFGGTFLVFTDYCRPSIRLFRADASARHLCQDA
jgi:transketolase